MVNGTTEFSKWFFREGIEVIESECGGNNMSIWFGLSPTPLP